MKTFALLLVLSCFTFTAGFYAGHRSSTPVRHLDKFTPAELDSIRRGVEIELRDWQRERGRIQII